MGTFPGSYYPDYLNQNWVQPGMTSAGVNDALLFAGADNLNREPVSYGSRNSNGDTNPTITGCMPKRRHMSIDSVLEPPSSAVSHSSDGGDSFIASTGPMSASSPFSPALSR